MKDKKEYKVIVTWKNGDVSTFYYFELRPLVDFLRFTRNRNDVHCYKVYVTHSFTDLLTEWECDYVRI